MVSKQYRLSDIDQNLMPSESWVAAIRHGAQTTVERLSRRSLKVVNDLLEPLQDGLPRATTTVLL